MTTPARFDTRAEYLANLDQLSDVAHSSRATALAQELAVAQRAVQIDDAPNYGPAFVTWTAKGARFLACATLHDTFHVFDEFGRNYGSWQCIDTFRAQYANPKGYAKHCNQVCLIGIARGYGGGR